MLANVSHEERADDADTSECDTDPVWPSVGLLERNLGVVDDGIVGGRLATLQDEATSCDGFSELAVLSLSGLERMLVVVGVFVQYDLDLRM